MTLFFRQKRQKDVQTKRQKEKQSYGQIKKTDGIYREVKSNKRKRKRGRHTNIQRERVIKKDRKTDRQINRKTERQTEG